MDNKKEIRLLSYPSMIQFKTFDSVKGCCEFLGITKQTAYNHLNSHRPLKNYKIVGKFLIEYSDGFKDDPKLVDISKEIPVKENRHRGLNDYFVTVRIVHEYTIQTSAYTKDEAERKVEELMEEDGSKWDYLEDNDCGQGGEKSITFKAEYLGKHGE